MHPRLASLSLLPALVGCATVGTMKELPPNAGGLARYATSPDTLRIAAQEALTRQKLRIVDSSGGEAGSHVLVATSSRRLVRVRIAPDSGRLSTVWIVTRSRYLPGQADGAPRLFEKIDTQLAPEALGPRPGMRVRATPHVDTTITGKVVRLTTDTLVLSRSADARIISIPARGALAMSRGSYGHWREGALIGTLLGAVVGTVIADTGFGGLSKLSGAIIGAGAGVLLGGAIGASLQTEVWSTRRRR